MGLSVNKWQRGQESSRGIF